MDCKSLVMQFIDVAGWLHVLFKFFVLERATDKQRIHE